MSAEPKTILVIDDEYLTQAMLEDILSERGYRVITANTASDALSQARLVRPDLIILDIILPDRDGLQVVRELRNEADTSRLPVILLSALSRSRSMDMRSVDAFVEKPVVKNVILAEVERIIGPAGQRAVSGT